MASIITTICAFSTKHIFAQTIRRIIIPAIWIASIAIVGIVHIVIRVGSIKMTSNELGIFRYPVVIDIATTILKSDVRGICINTSTRNLNIQIIRVYGVISVC